MCKVSESGDYSVFVCGRERETYTIHVYCICIRCKYVTVAYNTLNVINN